MSSIKITMEKGQTDYILMMGKVTELMRSNLLSEGYITSSALTKLDRISSIFIFKFISD